MFLSYMELAFSAILLLFVVTQIIVPGFRGTPLFPFFRSERHLVAELEMANEEVLKEDLRQKIRQRQRVAENLRKKMEPVSNDEMGAEQQQGKPHTDVAQKGEK